MIVSTPPPPFTLVFVLSFPHNLLITSVTVFKIYSFDLTAECILCVESWKERERTDHRHSNFDVAGEETDAHRVAFAAALLRGTATAWWVSLVLENDEKNIDESYNVFYTIYHQQFLSTRQPNQQQKTPFQLLKMHKRLTHPPTTFYVSNSMHTLPYPPSSKMTIFSQLSLKRACRCCIASMATRSALNSPTKSPI